MKLGQRVSRFLLTTVLLIISSPLFVKKAHGQAPTPMQAQPLATAQSLTASQSGTSVQIRPLAAFGKIALCVPFTTAVQPSASHQITIDAQPEVGQSINATIVDDTLRLGASAIVATAPIRVTVGLPSTALKSLSTNGVGSVIIFPGFTSRNLTINMAGTGSVLALGINATRAQISSKGCAFELATFFCLQTLLHVVESFISTLD